MGSKQVLLIGGFVEIIELCEDNKVKIIGIIDPQKKNNYLSYPILGTEEDIDVWRKDFLNYEVLITPDFPKIRKKLVKIYKRNGFSFYTLISNKANISKSSIIRTGSIVQAGANISSESIIGRFVKVNSNANIMHNVEVGNYSTLAPNAVLLGNVKIGQECYIGANSTILPNITICNNVTIGAGAVVTKNIDIPNTTYIGIPAKRL